MDHGLIEAQRHGHSRSPEWEKVRKAFATMFPACAVCKSKDKIQVHHVWPFHICVALGRPDLELDSRNLITLCEGEDEHHLLIGHLDDFRSANTNVRNDVSTFASLSKQEIKDDPLWQEKHQNRLKPLDELSDQEKANIKIILDKLYPKYNIDPNIHG